MRLPAACKNAGSTWARNTSSNISKLLRMKEWRPLTGTATWMGQDAQSERWRADSNERIPGKQPGWINGDYQLLDMFFWW